MSPRTCDQHRAVGQVGVEPFFPPVVEGEHVVFGGLDQELAPQLAEFFRLLRDEVSGPSQARRILGWRCEKLAAACAVMERRRVVVAGIHLRAGMCLLA